MEIVYSDAYENDLSAEDQLLAISPLDGRYARQVNDLRDYFSEYALMRYRVWIEIEYFIFMSDLGLKELSIDGMFIQQLRDIYLEFDIKHAHQIKQIEKDTNHDVKAVEYWLRDRFIKIGLKNDVEFIHFGLTSQDINNTAIPFSLSLFKDDIFDPQFNDLLEQLKKLIAEWKDIPMLARTHGQPATPTRLGKEFQVFVSRLEDQKKKLDGVNLTAKFGGATGNFNAHAFAYPEIEWPTVITKFINENFGLIRTTYTTQIDPYDSLAEFCDAFRRINTILIDLCRDIWHYVSIGYFKQRIKHGEVGSSAMPHKVNPIDFENAEGNLGIANALFDHFSNKLPISRLQRDLTDSTVLRNLGVPFGHTLIAITSIMKGLNKLEVNYKVLASDLANTPEVLAEAIQTILRRERYPDPYNALKTLTRGVNGLTLEDIQQFISELNVSDKIKEELFRLRPDNYLGLFPLPAEIDY